jgi:hypothetical protein
MPNIIKTKPPKKVVKLIQRSKKTAKNKVSAKPKSLTPVRPTPKSRPKSSPTDYYNCLLTYANQNWHSPVTGEKKKITACCKDCKQNAPALNNQREKELVTLITSYQQVGESLKKLLKPLK